MVFLCVHKKSIKCRKIAFRWNIDKKDEAFIPFIRTKLERYKLFKICLRWDEEYK